MSGNLQTLNASKETWKCYHVFFTATIKVEAAFCQQPMLGQRGILNVWPMLFINLRSQLPRSQISIIYLDLILIVNL